jgi:hypothetical protein
MLAYAFIVYLPFGYLYLTRAFTELPKLLAATLLGLSIALAVVEYYLFPILKALDITVGGHRVQLIKMSLSAFEVLLVGGIIFVHVALFRRPCDPRTP